MVSPTDVRGIDYTLYFHGSDGTISDIEYKGQSRAITETEKAILMEIANAGNATKEYFETHTYAEIFGVNAGSLPPVDVVAAKPTSAAAGNNAKILLLVVGVAAALILFNK